MRIGFREIFYYSFHKNDEGRVAVPYQASTLGLRVWRAE